MCRAGETILKSRERGEKNEEKKNEDGWIINNKTSPILVFCGFFKKRKKKKVNKFFRWQKGSTLVNFFKSQYMFRMPTCHVQIRMCIFFSLILQCNASMSLYFADKKCGIGESDECESEREGLRNEMEKVKRTNSFDIIAISSESLFMNIHHVWHLFCYDFPPPTVHQNFKILYCFTVFLWAYDISCDLILIANEKIWMRRYYWLSDCNHNFLLLFSSSYFFYLFFVIALTELFLIALLIRINVGDTVYFTELKGVNDLEFNVVSFDGITW